MNNVGPVAAGVSTTRYYLSLDANKDAGDVLLTGYRNVPIMAPGTTSSGSPRVTAPSSTPLGNYLLSPALMIWGRLRSRTNPTIVEPRRQP